MKTSYSLDEYHLLKKEIEGEKNTKSKNGSIKVTNKNKYKNQIVYHDGIKFHSKKERDRYIELRLMLRAGLIVNLRLQVSYLLEPAVKLHGENRVKPAIRYIADFVYTDVNTGLEVVEDVKSKATLKCPQYRNKKHKMKLKYNIDIIEIV